MNKIFSLQEESMCFLWWKEFSTQRGYSYATNDVHKSLMSTQNISVQSINLYSEEVRVV